MSRIWLWICRHAIAPRWPLWVAAFLLVLTAPALFGRLINDDLTQRLILQGAPALADTFSSPFQMFDFADGNPERTQARIEKGHLPWWTLPELKYRFLRPVAVLTHLFDYQLWPNSPWLMHLHSMLWAAACILVLGLLYRRLLPSMMLAGVALLLYAVDDSHAVPIASICNRNSLIGLFFGILVLYAHDRWRREGTIAWAIGACVALVVGLLGDEGTIAVGGYLLGYALFVDKARAVKGFLAILPYGVIVLVWHRIYGQLGYGAYGSLSHTDPGAFPLTFLSNLPGYGASLFLGQWLWWPAELYLVYPFWMKWAIVVTALVVGLLVLRALLPHLRREPALQMFGLGMVLAIVPAATTLPDDRSLLFIGLGAMPLIGVLVVGWSRDGQEGVPTSRWLLRTLVVCHLVLLPLLLPVRVALVDLVGGLINDAVHDMELDESRLEDQSLVVLNAPVMGIAPNISIIRLGEGKPAPARVRDLGPNFPAEPLTIERRDTHTLVVTRSSGFPHLFFRGQPEFQYEVGDEVVLSDVTITIEAVTEAGLPQRVAYRFAVPLEEDSLQWIVFDGKGFVAYNPPGVGAVDTR